MRGTLRRWITIGLTMSAMAGCTFTTQVSCVASFGPPAQFVAFDVLDGVATHPRGINNSGEIVGYFVDRQGPTRGFRGRLGSFTVIDFFAGAFAVEPRAINNAGKIALTVQDEGGISAFLVDGNSIIPLDKPPSVPVADPRGLNDDDFVVGAFSNPPGVSHGYVYPPGYDPAGFGAIDIRDSPTYLNGINNTRRMVGSVLVRPFVSRAFYLAGPDIASAVIIEIPFPGRNIQSSAHGITNAEDPACIKHVGTYHSRNGIDHGFVHLQAGQFARFDFPDAARTRAFGINDRGDIVGEFDDQNGVTHGFLATF
jgi:uncharacterized membrane protein